MNWKNITLEEGFVKQEINLAGSKAVNYIPLEQVDSFGVVSSENKLWLYGGCFALFCAICMAVGGQTQPMIFLGMVAIGLVGVYFLTRQTWFNVTSSQTKFSVQVMTSKEEIQAVNAFVNEMKQKIHCEEFQAHKQAA